MAQALPEWTDYQRRRWMRSNAHLHLRPDAQRWLRPDHKRFLLPGTDLRRLLPVFEGKANFNPDQPRVPAGHSEGGRWTDDPAWTGSATDGSGRRGDGFGSYEWGASKRARLARLGSRPHGHHYVPLKVYGEMKLLPETRKVFDDAKTGRLHGQTHRGGDGHEEYTKAVKELLGQYMARNGIKEETMTPAQAREFVDIVKRSDHPRIRDFNLRIWRRELHYWIRRGPRRE